MPLEAGSTMLAGNLPKAHGVSFPCIADDSGRG